MSAIDTSTTPYPDIEAGRRRSRLIFTVGITALAAASVIFNLMPAIGGEAPAAGRVALGAFGVVAGAVLWLRPGLGWYLAMAWALLQIPFIAWTPDGGSPTAQLLNFPLTFSSKTTVNGVVTAYSAIGVNVVGIVLAALLSSRRSALSDRR